MQNMILPQEMHLLQDNAVIRTRCAPEYITEQMLVRHVTRANLTAGDSILVQCLDHTASRLIAEAEYRVVERVTAMRTIEKPDFSTHTVEENTFKVEQWTPWRRPGEAAAEQSIGKVPTDVRWNVGRRTYEVFVAGEKVGEHTDKATAQQIANGEKEGEAA